MSKPVEIHLGRTMVVGKLPSLALFFRLQPLRLLSVGYTPDDMEAPPGAPEDWRPSPSLPPDDPLFNAVSLTVIARAAPSLFPAVAELRENTPAKVMQIHDVVFDALIERGLSFTEIGNLIMQGDRILLQLGERIGAMEDARKEARGNSVAPTGPSSGEPG